MDEISRNMKQKLHPVWAAASCPTQIIKYNNDEKMFKDMKLFFSNMKIYHTLCEPQLPGQKRIKISLIFVLYTASINVWVFFSDLFQF